MNRYRALLFCLGMALVTYAAPASAQEPTPAGDSTMPIEVQVTHGSAKSGAANVPVFLRAARPRGPFEPTAPKPQHEWTGFTNEAGTSTFSIPRDLAASGLKLHAVTTYAGVVYESAAITPGPGADLTITVYEKGLDASNVTFKNLRTIVDLWEGYLVFTQFYTLTNEGETALDTTALPGEDYEKGLPINLPVKAQGINASGSGEMVVINSTVYWNGTIEPGGTKNIQLRYSMSAKQEEFTFEQEMDYPVRHLEIVVPIQTRHARVPRLDDLELRPPGFPETDRGPGIWGLRSDIEFIGARGGKAERGETFRFQLRGLPFHKPVLPWVFLGLGIAFGLIIVALARRELRRTESERGKTTAVTALSEERDEILDELVALEKDYDEGYVTEGEYELESAGLRERLALVLKKIEDLENAK